MKLNKSILALMFAIALNPNAIASNFDKRFDLEPPEIEFDVWCSDTDADSGEVDSHWDNEFLPFARLHGIPLWTGGPPIKRTDQQTLLVNRFITQFQRAHSCNLDY